ncbi:UNVERIFIED_ORG: hypothetical protein CLV66_102343 [Actinomadura viridilutea]|uniref:MFS transporter n=1 Tax=Actinomadura rubrobrunea TaxID=115335 RepID=UPI000A969939|nr:MFS transporter [Actinomadura rubrobrunea]
MTTASDLTRLSERPPRPRRLPASAPAGRWRRWADPRNPVTAATLLAAALHLVWALFLAAEGGDLAAQNAWTYFARHHPDSPYSLFWYGGMHPPSYSVLSPYLMAWAGIRTVACITGTLSATLTAYLLVRFKAPLTLPAALWAAFSLSCNAAAGRVTFGLGLFVALIAAVVAFSRRGTALTRGAALTGLTVLTTLASPVAGLFVMVLAAALFLTGRRLDGCALAAGPPLVVGATTLLFPFKGVQPISFTTVVLPTLASVVAIVLCAPRRWRTVRAGAAVYLVGIVLTFLIPSPVGSNVERLALMFGGVLLLCAMAVVRDRRRLAVLGAAFAVTAVWQVVKPVDDLIHTRPAMAAARHSDELVAELLRRGADRGRVEVVPLRSHWEASGLGRRVVLARGWNRQVDADRNALFYDGTLTPAAYRAWLLRWGVRYVVLPEVETDWSAEREAELIREGQPWLREVWRDEHWRLFTVVDPQPLADPPAAVVRITADRLVLDVPRGGASPLVRVFWSPWLAVQGPDGACLSRDGDFTRLHTTRPGRYTIRARYRLPRGAAC